MALALDPNQARQVGPLLYRAYQEGHPMTGGPPPERVVPNGMTRGDNEHLHFLTLTGAINYHRDEYQLWDAARKTYEDAGTRYLFSPHAVAQLRLEKVQDDLQAHKLSNKPQKDADIWHRICETLVRSFEGDIETLLAGADYDVTEALKTIRSSKHDFPYLGGTKIGSLWADLLADTWQGHDLTGLKDVPLYLDRDVVAASVTLSVVKGPFEGPRDALEEAVQQAWAEGCAEIDFYPMQFYRPLTNLGEQGCQLVNEFPCEKRTDCPVFIFCGETLVRKTELKDGATGVAVGVPSRIATPISL